jgi:MFS family permease
VITVPVVRGRARAVFYGWWIVAGGALIQALVSGLFSQAYGAYVVLLQEQFGWSKTTFSVAYSLQPAQNGLLGPLQGWLLDRFGPRSVIQVGIVLLGTGFMLFSQIHSLPMFYLSFFVVSLGANFAGFFSVAHSVVNWFERKRSTAMGMVQLGMGIGGLAVPLVAWSLTSYGWRSIAFASGIIFIVAGLPLARTIRHRPEAYGYRPDGVKLDDTLQESASVQASAATRAEFTPREALRTPAFWFISLGHGTAMLVVSALTVHLIPHLTEGLGFSLSAAAAIVSLLTGTMMVGTLLGGYLGDHFSKRIVAAVAMFGHATALLLLAGAHSLLPVILFAVVQGMSHGTRGVLMQPMRADYFGRKSFGRIVGLSNLIVMWGMIGGPVFAGIMADQLGSYRLGFTVLAILSALGSVFFVLARKPEASVRARAIG